MKGYVLSILSRMASVGKVMVKKAHHHHKHRLLFVRKYGVRIVSHLLAVAVAVAVWIRDRFKLKALETDF